MSCYGNVFVSGFGVFCLSGVLSSAKGRTGLEIREHRDLVVVEFLSVGCWDQFCKIIWFLKFEVDEIYFPPFRCTPLYATRPCIEESIEKLSSGH